MFAIQRFTQAMQNLGSRSRVGLRETLASIYPEKYRELSETQRKRLVEQGHECARTHGLDAAQGPVLCSGLALLLGHGFARDPQFPWIADVLNDQRLSDPAQRLAAMKAAAVSHLNRWFAATEQTT
jgi:hypothetical protein